MSISIISKSSYALSNNTTTAPIPAPSNLQVGKLMIAIICYAQGTLTPPSGWTLAYSNFGQTYASLSIYKKVVTSDDLLVSTYDLSVNSSYKVGGIIYQLNDADFDNTQFKVHSQGFTPTANNSLLFPIGLGSDNDSDPATFSGYSVTGGMSPTFTEDFDSYYVYGNDCGSMGIASGLYSSTSNITAFNVTVSGSPDSSQIQMLLISELIAVTGPANLKTYNTNVKSNIKTINTNPIANVKSLNTNV